MNSILDNGQITQSSTRLTGIPLHLAQLGWWSICLISLGLFILAVPLRYTQLLGDPFGFEIYLKQLGLSIEFFAVYGTGFDILVAVVCYCVAIFTFLRRSADWMAMLVTITIILITVGILPLVEVLPDRYPGLSFPLLTLRALGINCLTLTFFLFPSGQFVPTWVRWICGFTLAYTISWFVFPEWIPPASLTELDQLSSAVPMIIFVTGIGIGILSQIYRYRYKATYTQRQQTKIVVFGFFLTGLLLTLLSLLTIIFPAILNPGLGNVLFILIGIAVVLAALLAIPLSITLAVLRYRLWDIDVIIRRTLVYTSLTALLAILYFIIVTLLQNLFVLVSNQQSPLSIVFSTLVIAWLFNPIRNRIQKIIDQRFYRRQYNAEQALAQFTGAVQQGSSLIEMLIQLDFLVQETMQPSHISIWIKQIENLNSDEISISS